MTQKIRAGEETYSAKKTIEHRCLVRKEQFLATDGRGGWTSESIYPVIFIDVS